ncbi:hypothetical protein M405DRAFT_467205 [Rhizopogon salebrosus TDB-379]|nr:hypothetical protein M405DRAFT_467205 [Rhizopogon salebrosus TDB-379]
MPFTQLNSSGDVSGKESLDISARFFYECYDYGVASDFDRWTEMTRDEYWSWNNFSAVRTSTCVLFP